MSSFKFNIGNIVRPNIDFYDDIVGIVMCVIDTHYVNKSVKSNSYRVYTISCNNSKHYNHTKKIWFSEKELSLIS